MGTVTTVTVTGMTCDHCAASVRDEVGGLDGVTSVDVDLATGAVTVASQAPVPPESLAAAVEEAGYAVAGP